MKTICLYLALAIGLIGSEEPKKAVPSMPDEVTLTSGRVLRNVQVIRWESNRVVLKHSAGADPISFPLIKSVPNSELIEMRNEALTKQAAAAKAGKEAARATAKEEEKRAQSQAIVAEQEKHLDELRETASRRGTLMVGQTYDQVRRVLGDYIRINKYNSGSEEQAIYESPGRDKHYVYYTDGRVISWQSQDRR